MNARHEQPTELITGVITDARDLAVAEVDKLKAEAKQVGENAKFAGIGFGVLVVAAIMLGQSIAHAMTAAGVPPWAAFFVVALVATIAGTLFVKYRHDLAKTT